MNDDTNMGNIWAAGAYGLLCQVDPMESLAGSCCASIAGSDSPKLTMILNRVGKVAFGLR